MSPNRASSFLPIPEGPDGDAGHVAVVGAGITGLATAWFLRSRAEVPPRVTVVEAGPRAGGQLASSELAGARPPPDGVRPRRRLRPDAGGAEVIARGLGPAVAARLVDPLLGGIPAGRPDRLSVRAVAPPLADAAGRGHGSLMRALAATRT